MTPLTPEELRYLRYSLETLEKGENWIRKTYNGMYKWYTHELKGREKQRIVTSLREKLFEGCPHFADDTDDIDHDRIIEDVLGDLHDRSDTTSWKDELGRNDTPATGGRGGSDIHAR
jgi:hypothetical protein